MDQCIITEWLDIHHIRYHNTLLWPSSPGICGPKVCFSSFSSVSHQFLIISKFDDEKCDEKLMRTMRNLPKKEGDRTCATFSNSLLLVLYHGPAFPNALTGCCACLPALNTYPWWSWRAMAMGCCTDKGRDWWVILLHSSPPCPMFSDILVSCVDLIPLFPGICIP